MELLEEIQELFANSDTDTAYVISSLPPQFKAWVVRFIDGFGVAVPYDGTEISEEFANVSLYDIRLNLSGHNEHCLLLKSSLEASRNEFAVFCSYFVSPGENGADREELVTSPTAWWRRWKNLIGNGIIEKKPYAVLGELLMYEYLLKIGKNVRWEGASGSSHDLICPDADYEVKSTLNRYDKLIHISGQFQLQRGEKPLFLLFCRFESNSSGICIDDIVDRIVKLYGETYESINGKLGRLGYSLGNSARKEYYQLHGVTQYAVDDRFPRIVPEMLKAGELPRGIKKLAYDVDLSVVSGTSILDSEDQGQLSRNLSVRDNR